jgi:hypothetical protein
MAQGKQTKFIQSVARFVVRNDQNPPFFFMGSALETDLLKPGYVYQIEQIGGELIIRELGKSAIPDHYEAYQEDKFYPGSTWGWRIDQIVTHGNWLYTEAEYQKVVESELDDQCQ